MKSDLHCPCLAEHPAHETTCGYDLGQSVERLNLGTVGVLAWSTEVNIDKALNATYLELSEQFTERGVLDTALRSDLLQQKVSKLLVVFVACDQALHRFKVHEIMLV